MVTELKNVVTATNVDLQNEDIYMARLKYIVCNYSYFGSLKQKFAKCNRLQRESLTSVRIVAETLTFDVGLATTIRWQIKSLLSIFNQAFKKYRCLTKETNKQTTTTFYQSYSYWANLSHNFTRIKIERLNTFYYFFLQLWNFVDTRQQGKCF